MPRPLELTLYAIAWLILLAPYIWIAVDVTVMAIKRRRQRSYDRRAELRRRAERAA